MKLLVGLVPVGMETVVSAYLLAVKLLVAELIEEELPVVELLVGFDLPSHMTNDKNQLEITN